MVLTDTHTHLYAKEYQSDREEVVKRSIDAGVSRMFLPNIDKDTIAGLLDLAGAFPQNCFPMAGIHPCAITGHYEEDLAVAEKTLKSEGSKFYAVGEIGLDFYRETAYEVQQISAFRAQIELAQEFGLPVVLHVRNAFDRVFDIVSEYKGKGIRGVFHCFSGTADQAKKVMDLGSFRLGIGGVVTFKNSGMDKLIPQIPLDFIVLETDSPYLAPVPYRGQRNESSYLPLIARKVAELKNCSIEVVAEKTTKNSIDVFGI